MDDRESKVLNLIAADVLETRRVVEELSDRFSDYRVHIEGRLTRVEFRSTSIGAILGAVGGFVGHKLGFW